MAQDEPREHEKKVKGHRTMKATYTTVARARSVQLGNAHSDCPKPYPVPHQSGLSAAKPSEKKCTHFILRRPQNARYPMEACAESAEYREHPYRTRGCNCRCENYASANELTLWSSSLFCQINTTLPGTSNAVPSGALPLGSRRILD